MGSVPDQYHRGKIRCFGVQNNVNMAWRQSSLLPIAVWRTTSTGRHGIQTTTIYVLPHQRLWTFDVLVCPLSAKERFLSQPLVCGTVFHRTSVTTAPSLHASSAVVLNHISSHFLIPLSDSSLICTVPAQWLVILDTKIAISFTDEMVWEHFLLSIWHVVEKSGLSLKFRQSIIHWYRPNYFRFGWLYCYFRLSL